MSYAGTGANTAITHLEIWPAVTASTAVTAAWQPWTGTTPASFNTSAQVQVLYDPGQQLWTWWPVPYQPAPAMSQEDIDAILTRHRAEVEQAELARQVADARATQLLLSVLSKQEAASYTRDGFFEVQGSAGGWWRIRRNGQAGNVDELEQPGGKRIASWCCHPPGGLPDADAHLAQLLQLVTDEEGFRQTGNRTPRRRLLAGMAA